MNLFEWIQNLTRNYLEIIVSAHTFFFKPFFIRFHSNETYEAAMHPATVTRKTPATLGRFNELTPPPPAPATQAPPPVKK